MTNRQRNYEAGYKAGINGKPFNRELVKYTGYEEGWDHGHCDMPTLEELIPIDIEHEASEACLS